MLIIIRAIIEDPVGVQQEIEVVEVNYRLLLGHLPETVLVDEQIEVLYAAETLAENFCGTPGISTAYVVDISPFLPVEVSISLVEDMHP